VTKEPIGREGDDCFNTRKYLWTLTLQVYVFRDAVAVTVSTNRCG
jgi:hypothetical protein